jgi:hypothetical protein
LAHQQKATPADDTTPPRDQISALVTAIGSLPRMLTDHTEDLVTSASAVFSADRAYRYVLTRQWAPQLPTMTVIGLNPSVADALVDDPTIRRVAGFARREGCGALVMINLFALRAVHPEALIEHTKPVGEHTDQVLAHCLGHLAGLLVAAWGVHGHLGDRATTVTAALRASGRTVHCLGRTNNGEPRHPLYLPADALLLPYR